MTIKVIKEKAKFHKFIFDNRMRTGYEKACGDKLTEYEFQLAAESFESGFKQPLFFLKNLLNDLKAHEDKSLDSDIKSVKRTISLLTDYIKTK